jgi:hypothetical protein
MTGLARLWLTYAGVLVLVGCSKPQAGFIGSDLNKVISADAKSLAGVDLDKLKTTAFYRAREKRLGAISGLSNQFGIDARRDLTKILLMSAGKDAVLAIQGRFPKTLLDNGPSTTSTEFAGHKIFSLGSDAVSFPKPDIALFGQNAALRHTLEGYEAGASGIPAELSQIFAQLSPADSVWCVSRGHLPFAGIARRTNIVSILSNFAGYIDSTAIGIFVDANIHLKGQVDCLSLEGAKRVDDALRGGIGLARLALKDKERDLLQVYNSVRVRKENKTVFVQLDLDGTLTGKLVNRLPGMAGPAH